VTYALKLVQGLLQSKEKRSLKIAPIGTGLCIPLTRSY
jgi:hypothetical protein